MPLISPEQAKAIYATGEEAVVEAFGRQQAELLELRQQNEVLGQKVAQLEKAIARLSKDSSTSHKPPSSDITKAKKGDKDAQGKGSTSKAGKRSKRKRGGQPGHPKHERTLIGSEAVEQTHHYGLDECPGCSGANLWLLDEEPRIRQQVELQEIVWTVEEHRAYGYYCRDCDEVHYADFPESVVKEGLFRQRMTALVAYMKNVCHASFSTIRKFIRDVLGLKVSRGYLAKLIQKVSAALDQPYEELLNRLPLEAKLNVDETGHKENGQRFWTWVFKAELYVLFRIDKSRGSDVLIEVLGREFNGVLGCDYFSAYRKYMKDFDVTVQFCLAHLIRDIRYLTTLPDAQTQAYGERLLQGMRELFAVIHSRDERTVPGFGQALERAKATLLQIALDEVPSELDAQGKEQKSEAQNLANRFRHHGQAYFEFITTPGIDPTNNVAEQAIRFIVIDRHVTQGTRSAKGRRANERLWTIIATCSLQGRSAFAFIEQAIHAFWYDKPSPSLLLDST
jgi:transposase